MEVINKLWIPKYEAQTYMKEAEPLTDFKYLLESGINQLKTDVKSLQTSNIITFYNNLTTYTIPANLSSTKILMMKIQILFLFLPLKIKIFKH